MQTGSGTESRSKYKVEQITQDKLTRSRQFGSMTEKLTGYEKLLKDLASRASDSDAQLINSILDKVRKNTIYLKRPKAHTSRNPTTTSKIQDSTT